MQRLLRLATLVVVLAAIGCGITAFLYKQRFDGPGPLAADTTLVIPRGAGLETISRELLEAGVIDDDFLFRVGTRLLGAARNMKAGEYAFPAAVSMRAVVDILISGKTVLHRLTIPEGQTSSEIIALVNATEGLEGILQAVPLEGSLLPETYHFTREDPRAVLVERMTIAMNEALAELWEGRAEGLPLKSPEEAVILASIVEKETGVGSERALVAGVFINRLRKGMQLQSDPTVIYGITHGKAPLGRSLWRKDLEKPTPYNTYTIYGLPPGPIANPGRAALEAVMHPADTDYLYFVADGSGGHVFAKTLTEHNRNVAAWRKFQKSQKAGNSD
jgi:UPF0755 protein